MKRLIFVLALSLFGLSGASNTYAGDREDAMALVDNAIVKIKTNCVFTAIINITDSKSEILVATTTYIGTGYFAERPMADTNQYPIFTAGHVLNCGYRAFSELFQSRTFGNNVASIELKSAVLEVNVEY